ncbi:hypothetical protein B0H21DRAFT_700388, partial [Amylocystis lapponica]
HTRLAQIKLIYNIQDELTLLPRSPESGVSVAGYPTCILLPAHHRTTLTWGIIDKVIGAFCTRFAVTPAAVWRALPAQVEEWGKLLIVNDGDTMRAALLDGSAHDGRDTTFVRYEQLVDKNAHVRNRPVILEPRTFYGQLQQILVIELSAIPSSAHSTSKTFILALIQVCNVKEDMCTLDIHYYSQMGRLEVVNVTTIQCVIGRVSDRNRWAVIDRSGLLSCAVYTEDSE